MSAYTGQNFINGTRSAKGDSRLQSFDATTGQELPGFFTEATREEVDAAAQAARPYQRPDEAVRQGAAAR